MGILRISVGNGINRYAVRLSSYDGDESAEEPNMNILALIKESALKQQALENARKVTLKYRGNKYSKTVIV
jgi:hypothetical protein